jgi:hypothetical protein
MNQLCDDMWREILEYLSAKDYSTLRLSTISLKKIVDNNTCFSEISRTISQNNITFNCIESIFYNLCSLNKAHLDKFIYERCKTDIFPLRDGFVKKYCDLYNFDILKNIFVAKCNEINMFVEFYKHINLGYSGKKLIFFNIEISN